MIPNQHQRFVFYNTAWAVFDVEEDVRQLVVAAANRLQSNYPAYGDLAEDFDLPSEIIGCIHMLECGFDFEKQLANGDPLTDRTIHAPIGLPRVGDPPFSWNEAALAALKDFEQRWPGIPPVKDIATALNFLDCWNGLGYWNHDINSPYLWGGTDFYAKGKFGADGVFDPELVSLQIGCVPVLKALGFKP